MLRVDTIAPSCKGQNHGAVSGLWRVVDLLLDPLVDLPAKTNSCGYMYKEQCASLHQVSVGDSKYNDDALSW